MRLLESDVAEGYDRVVAEAVAYLLDVTSLIGIRSTFSCFDLSETRREQCTVGDQKTLRRLSTIKSEIKTK